MMALRVTKYVMKVLLVAMTLINSWYLISQHVSKQRKVSANKETKIFSTTVPPDVRQAGIQSWEIVNKSSILKSGKMFPDNAEIPMTVSSRFLIPNQDICSGLLNLRYVIIVHSAPDHFDRRARLRRTWASQNLFPSFNNRVAFILGSTANGKLQEKILQENGRFGDIVQGSFMDHYRNLTLKAVMGLRWIKENCAHANYVIKTDDDVFVNIRDVSAQVFPILAERRLELVCSVEPHATIFREGDPRKKLQKWTMPASYFSGLKRYPMPFCYGYAVFYTTFLAAQLFDMAKSTPFYRLDDVYVYGILASKVSGLTWRNATKAFYKTKTETETAVAMLPNGQFLVGTAESDQFMTRLWETMKTV